MEWEFSGEWKLPLRKTIWTTRKHTTLDIIMQYKIKHIALGNIAELLFIPFCFLVMTQTLNTIYLSNWCAIKLKEQFIN